MTWHGSKRAWSSKIPRSMVPGAAPDLCFKDGLIEFLQISFSNSIMLLRKVQFIGFARVLMISSCFPVIFQCDLKNL